jgi:hypothetical protein
MPPTSFATRSADWMSKSLMATITPSAAKRRAAAAPRPDPPPVMKATWFSRAGFITED